VTVVLATRNPGKVLELRRILEPYGIALVGLEEVAPYEPAAETGATFADNALAKAVEACERTGLPAVADDSGLCVVALNGMPGVLSARWAGRHGDDGANLDLLLGQLADLPEVRRDAAFVCAAAAAFPDGRVLSVEGRLAGHLLTERRGTKGFGYDPVFVPVGGSHTTAELEPAAKDAISHRGLAFRALAPLLAEVLAG
jgi:XTP/dITP diphosphohydrolase